MKFILVVFMLFIATYGVTTGLAGTVESKHAKVIDFDDEVIEGLNKKPWDSLSEIAEQDKRHRKPHLYLKRVGFRPEIAQNLKVLPHSQ